MLENVRVVPLTPVNAPFVVWPLRRKPLTVLVDPVSVSPNVAISSRALASMVKLFATVTAVAAVTFALVFEINKNANPVAPELMVCAALPSK